MTDHPTNEALLDCAVAAARAGGEHALRNLDRRTEVHASFDHDVKLCLDIECQEKAGNVVHANFPSHDILGEEGEALDSVNKNKGSSYQWIIDPIDGTVNFTHSLPNWCCSIAVKKDGQTVAGAVFAPELDELYTALTDGPALLNDRPLTPSTTDKLASSIIMTGTNENSTPGLSRFAMFEAISTHVQRPRIMGSAALDVCRVARGHADGYFEAGIYVWDIAAAALLVECAGGKTDTLVENSDHSVIFLATNGLIHDELRGVVEGLLGTR